MISLGIFPALARVWWRGRPFFKKQKTKNKNENDALVRSFIHSTTQHSLNNFLFTLLRIFKTSLFAVSDISHVIGTRCDL